jgi:hypothetical protein
MPKMRWIVSPNINMRVAAEGVGFKIERLRHFAPHTQTEFKAGVVNWIIHHLDEAWVEKRESNNLTSFSASLAAVERGVYVLCLDGRLCVNYDGGNSRVLYIGKGKLRQRIKSHLEAKLLDFFLQIPGIEFRFYLTEPKKPGHGGYFHDFEYDLLHEFSKLYGSARNKWPLFNKAAGNKHENQYVQDGWKLPLKNTKAGYLWSLSPGTVKDTPTFQDE